MNQGRNTVMTTQVQFKPQGYLTETQLDRLENWLDSKFSLPGTNIKFGFDSLIGLVPGVGDIAMSGLSTIFIADVVKMGGRKRTVFKMAANIAIDLVVGAIPIVGDLFDFAFKSNTKNLELLRRERERLAKKVCNGS